MRLLETLLNSFSDDSVHDGSVEPRPQTDTPVEASIGLETKDNSPAEQQDQGAHDGSENVKSRS